MGFRVLPIPRLTPGACMESVNDGILRASDPPAYAEGFYGGGFIEARSVSDGIMHTGLVSGMPFGRDKLLDTMPCFA